MPPDLLSLDAAQARFLALARPKGPMRLGLREAAGRRLAAAVAARLTQPPADVSAMDGYAVRFADLPGPLAVIGESAAGRPFPHALGPRAAVRIFTGAHVPDGADTVAIQEDMARSGSTVILVADGPRARGANIRPCGQDFRTHQALLGAGAVLTPAAIGLVAAAGNAEVTVHRRPRVALVATGDELVAPGILPGAGQIISSNGPMLAALVEAAGGEVVDNSIVADSRADLEAAFEAAAGVADVVLTIGGASVGDHDLVRPALLACGARIDFWRIAIRPGKPLLAGSLADAVVLGLPGNPASAFVCAHLFLVPLLRALAGDPRPLPQAETALATAALAPNGPRRHFLRGVLSRDHAGRLTATPAVRQDSSLLTVLAASDCLIVREENAGPVPALSPVPVLRL